MKECRDCKVVKDDVEFSKRDCNSDGLYSYCRECCRKKSKANYHKNKEKHLVSQKKYKENNKGKLKQYTKDYYKKNSDIIKEKVSVYRKKNKDSISLKEAKKRLSDVDRFAKNRAKHLKWAKNNRESLSEYQYEWYQNNKEKRRAHVILRRAILSGEIMRPENCSKCQKQCKPDGHHTDYSKALDVIWLCRACHSRESPRTVIKAVEHQLS